MTDVSLTLAGEEVYLLSERALYWPGTSTLVAATLSGNSPERAAQARDGILEKDA